MKMLSRFTGKCTVYLVSILLYAFLLKRTNKNNLLTEGLFKTYLMLYVTGILLCCDQLDVYYVKLFHVHIVCYFTACHVKAYTWRAQRHHTES